MGRLFWKFFFAFWLALLVAGISVGVTVWLRHEASHADAVSAIDSHATAFVIVAKDIHEKGGDKALRDFLEHIQPAPVPDIYAIDENDAELLGRQLDAELINTARELFKLQQGIGPIAQITAETGQRYLLFAPMPQKRFGKHFHAHPSVSADGPSLTETTALPAHLAPHPPRPPGPSGRRISLPALIAFGFVASFLFSILLAWYFTKPIRSLREAFTQVAEGNLNTRVANVMGNGRDELTELGNNFDEMAMRIQALVNGQQRLLHDVSHELRSPLARMQAAIGIAQQQPEKVGDILHRLERDSQRISDLVGELLLLCRLETGVNDDRIQPVNMNELMADIIDDARFEATTKDVSVNYIASESDIILVGQTELLHRGIENVIRNAVKYSDDHTKVSVEMTLTNQGNQLRIDVKDRGPGVKETELETIFDAFYRSGSKRLNDSVGLGLTIALRAIEVHGGKIKAHNRDDGGLHIEIVIPYPNKETPR